MPAIETLVVDAAKQAIDSANELVRFIASRDFGSSNIAISRTSRRIEALPLDASEHCYLINTLRDVRDLLAKTEWSASHWQAQQIVRKLGNFHARWTSSPLQPVHRHMKLAVTRGSIRPARA